MAFTPLFFFRGSWNSDNGRFASAPFINYSSGTYNGNGQAAICGIVGTNDIVLVMNGAGSSYNPCDISYRTVWTSSNYSSYAALLDPLNEILPPVTDLVNNSSILVFPATNVNGTYKVSMNKPYFIDSSTNLSNKNYVAAFPYYEYEDSSSDNYNDLISAILMIPATIICLACMSVIFKMFINRKMRGQS